MNSPMPAAYDPQAIEAGWYARWEEAGLFTADPYGPKPKYSIAIPPPNITGELHMGHATNGTIQDILSRYKRMRGHEVLWLPGYDHAAIATQNVIEKQLAAEGTTKEELGRAAFNARVAAWYEEVGGTIISQFRELGASLDWTRLRFTMDPAYVRAVLTAFVHFYDKGWMYRGPRIVNWCPRCQSAISDLEVEWREHEDSLYTIRYPIEGGGEIAIATVRPETMLADTGVAVNPSDARYAGLAGKTAILPLVGRRLPIVADPAVEKEFGTGALKVTPGHDATDYEIGQRHGLAIINAMHTDGRMNVPDLPAYEGLPALEARERVVEDLEREGYLLKVETYVHEVGHCDRCGTVIEPLISEQWWLKMDELSRMALQASEQRKVRWHPERYERTYLDWLGGLRDWNVSRQLWLGHRIPVFTCPNGHRFASVDPPAACSECGAAPLEQDPDVLDTWFSSALWPFATLGWPEKTPELEAFYPTALNSTAREIINLWVSRMIMTGLEFIGEVPFHDVVIHCVIQAADGRRMSKSLGTGVDPRKIIERYGADALRAWCAAVAMSSQDVRFDETRIEGYRRFGNKLWNATRLVVENLGEEIPATPAADADLELVDRWILSRLEAAKMAATAGIEGYSFQTGINGLYDFTWHEYCDWYLEAIKPRLRDGDPAARAVATHVLDVLFRLLHPFMPFLTEELWHRLPDERGFLLAAEWPELEPGFAAEEAERIFGRVMRLVEEIRVNRQEAGAARKGGRIKLQDGELAQQAELIAQLAQLEVVDQLAGDGIALSTSPARVELPVDVTAERRGEGELKRLGAELERVEARLGNPGFRSRAPGEVVAKEEAKATELREAIKRLS